MDSEFDSAVRRALAAEPLTGKRVVDFGCGAGVVGIWMAGEGAEVYLVGTDRAVVDGALAAAKSAGLERRVRGIVVEGERLDMFADRGFDLVLLRSVPAGPLLGEVARAMKPGARLVLAASTEIDGARLPQWFNGARVEWPPKQSWLERMAGGRKKPGGAVITARRAG